MRFVGIKAALLMVIAFLSASCQHKGEWWKSPRQYWPQILLTNHIELEGYAPITGASSFLIIMDGDTIGCTARHLIEEPMGFIPPVAQDSLNPKLIYWKAFVRRSKDSVEFQRLLNSKPSLRDFLLFKTAGNPKITPLEIMPSSPKPQDQALIFGCQRNDTSCKQDYYEAVVVAVNNREIVIEASRKIDGAGFSGGPVINGKGELIGIISGVENADITRFYLEPAKAILKFYRETISE